MTKRVGSFNREVTATITLNGEEFDAKLSVDYDYMPGTPESGVSGPPENYDPGDAGSVDITCIMFEGNDIHSLLDESTLDFIRDEIDAWECEP